MFTALVISFLIVAGAATATAGVVVYKARKRQLGSGAGDRPQLTDGSAPSLLERTIFDLRVGDVVQYQTKDFLVEGVIEYEEEGHRWRAARMLDIGVEYWLVTGLTRHDRGQDIRLLEIDREVELTDYPATSIMAGGHRFSHDKRGTALAKFNGDVDMVARGASPDIGSTERCRWWSYSGTGNQSLIVEQWGDDFRVLRGERISTTMLDMMPGS